MDEFSQEISDRNMAVNKLLKFATDAFANASVNSQFFPDLLNAVNHIKLADFNFDMNLIEYPAVHATSERAASIAYIHLLETSTFSSGIFILRKNSEMPLHDHPKMHGIIKVIYGKMTITSYTIDTDKLSVNERSSLILEAKKRLVQPALNPITYCTRIVQERTLGTEDEACVLTPTVGNLHKIVPYNGAAVFLDILSPPYDSVKGSRMCHYFRDISINQDQLQTDKKLKYLVEVNQPKNYWVEQASYAGPEINDAF